MSRPLLQVRGAEVVRDGRTILSVDRFDIHEGEHLAILGPNGAGKSTLIGLLTRDVLPLWAEPPAVLWRGDARAELAQIRRTVGVVSNLWQEVVDVRLPVFEVVLGGRFGTLGVPPHLRAQVTRGDVEAAEAAMSELGLAGFEARDMRTLSTGEARRALIARALVLDPAVVVLDEPAAGLDPTAAWQLRATVRRLAEGGRTLVLVTHHVEDIVRQVERVVMLSDGHIVADGDKRELLTSGRMSSLFDVPLDVEERDGEYRLW